MCFYTMIDNGIHGLGRDKAMGMLCKQRILLLPTHHPGILPYQSIFRSNITTPAPTPTSDVRVQDGPTRPATVLISPRRSWGLTFILHGVE